MYWLITLILATICSLFNPFIGLFCLFPVVQIIICFCFDAVLRWYINIIRHKSEGNEAYLARATHLVKVWSVVWLIATIAMTIIACLVSAAMWVFASGWLLGYPVRLTPINIVPNDMMISGILLGASIVLMLATAVLIFFRRKKIMSMLNEKAEPTGDGEGGENIEHASRERVQFHIGVLPIVAIVISAVSGAMSAYVGWLSFLLHIFPLMLVGMTYFLVWFYMKAAEKAERSQNNNLITQAVRHNTSYFFENISRGGKLNSLMIFVGCVVFAVVSGTLIVCQMLVSYGTFTLVDIGNPWVWVAFSVSGNFAFCAFYILRVKMIGRE